LVNFEKQIKIIIFSTC